MQTQEKIPFEVETSRVLEILSKEIYDSPNALLRENLQNAYDAILMRCTAENINIRNKKISIQVEPHRLTIIDEGIGMSEDVLRNNFWKAGSSGKKTELAKKSGVIGTFGIGAMANFGVCTRLQIETRNIDSDTTLISIAERDKLSISHDCIELKRQKDTREAGTTLIADLEPSYTLHEKNVSSYLEPYVRFLPVGVYLNGKLISQKDFGNYFHSQEKEYKTSSKKKIRHNLYDGTLEVCLNSNGQVLVKLTDLKIDRNNVLGELFLIQGKNQIMGLRNYFGLAPIPVSSYYQLGGIANLSILQPTAGREALSRDSIKHIKNIISLVEAEVSKDISQLSYADRNTYFLNYVYTHNRNDLADNVKIDILPKNDSVCLGKVKTYIKEKESYYYTGRDKSIIETFSSGSYLLHLSNSNPRRGIQQRYINSILKIPSVPDKPTVIKEYLDSELTLEEVGLLIRVGSVLADDYLMPNATVTFAEISHNVAIFVEKKNETVEIKIARNNSIVQPLLECYKTAREVFGGFVKDFVRTSLYQRISQYVPSSNKEGMDAMHKLLMRNKELFRYEEDELGNLESLMSDYLSGDISLGQVLKEAKRRTRPQTQIVRRSQIGNVENELPGIVDSPGVNESQSIEGLEYTPAPPIMREEFSSTMKILTVDQQYGQLNYFQLFLGLSDKLFKEERFFFQTPHTTKIIWAVHRIIYVFTDLSKDLSLYYDIELKEPLAEEAAKGLMLPTTTIITKNRIYIPVPTELHPTFEITDGAKEFFVRFYLM